MQGHWVIPYQDPEGQGEGHWVPSKGRSRERELKKREEEREDQKR